MLVKEYLTIWDTQVKTIWNQKKAPPPPLVSSMEALLGAFWILRVVPCDFVRFSSGGCGLLSFVLVGLRDTPFICKREKRNKTNNALVDIVLIFKYSTGKMGKMPTSPQCSSKIQNLISHMEWKLMQCVGIAIWLVMVYVCVLYRPTCR